MRTDGADAPGLIAVALFPTVHMLCGRHGLRMNTYGRELRSLNNEPDLNEPDLRFRFERKLMNDAHADAAREKLRGKP
jgi:hypothetical protein